MTPPKKSRARKTNRKSKVTVISEPLVTIGGKLFDSNQEFKIVKKPGLDDITFRPYNKNNPDRPQDDEYELTLHLDDLRELVEALDSGVLP